MRFLSLLFLSACAAPAAVGVATSALYVAKPSDTIRYFIEPSAYQFVAAARDASVAYQDGLGVRLVRTWDLEDSYITIRAAPAEQCSGSRVARTNACGDVTLCTNKRQDWLSVAHEFGHAFGMRHVTDGPAVMNPDRAPSYVRALTQRDRFAWEQRSQNSIFSEFCAEIRAARTR